MYIYIYIFAHTHIYTYNHILCIQVGRHGAPPKDPPIAQIGRYFLRLLSLGQFLGVQNNAFFKGQTIGTHTHTHGVAPGK